MSPNLGLTSLNSDTDQTQQNIENINTMLLDYLDRMKKRSILSEDYDRISVLTLKLDVWSWKLLRRGPRGHFYPLPEFRRQNMLQMRRARKC